MTRVNDIRETDYSTKSENAKGALIILRTTLFSRNSDTRIADMK